MQPLLTRGSNMEAGDTLQSKAKNERNTLVGKTYVKP